MSGAGLLVCLTVCLAALEAVTATAIRFAMTGDLDAQAVGWSSGLVGIAGALLARTWQESTSTPTGTPADPVSVEPVAKDPSGSLGASPTA
jgi:hypothetical protein